MRHLKKRDIRFPSFIQFTRISKKKVNQLETNRSGSSFCIISQAELGFILIYTYSLNRCWTKYIDRYYDLFISEEEAIKKAKSHAVGVICKTIHRTTGCGIGMIYEAIRKEVHDLTIHLHPSILDSSSRFHFILSLTELDEHYEA